MDMELIGRYYKKIRQIYFDKRDGYIPIPLSVAKLYKLYTGSVYKCILNNGNIIDLRICGDIEKNSNFGKQFEKAEINIKNSITENIYIPSNAAVGDYLLVELYKYNYLKVKIIKREDADYELFSDEKDFGFLNDTERTFKLLDITLQNYKKITNNTFKFNSNGQNIIIGPNGSGKTTILESIIYIFAALDNGINFNFIDFDFCINYLIDDNKVKIEKISDKFYLSYNLENDDNPIEEKSLQDLREDLRNLNVLPSKVISYYSGIHNTFNKIYTNVGKSRQTYLTKKKNQLLDIGSSNFDLLKKSNFKFYQGEDKMVPLYLLYIMLGDQKEVDIVKQYCQIDDVIQITLNGSIPERKDNYRTLLQSIAKYFTMIGFESELNIINNKYFFKLRTETLKKLNEFKRIDIFNIINNTMVLLKSNISLKILKGNQELTDEMLSEGHRQLIKVIGAISLGKGGLVLLDEPDSHLNPNWKYYMNDIIEQIDSSNESTILISTHEPLLLNGISKDQVLMVQDSNKNMEILTPTEDTYGLGIDGILTSEYFGLKTSYDKKTVESYDRRNELFVKKLKNILTDDEKNELRNLMFEIGKFPVSYNSIDYLYYDFLKVYMDTSWYKKIYLTPDEIKQRHDKFVEIIDNIYQNKGE